MKWYKLNALAIHVMVFGILLEIIFQAHYVWAVFSLGCLLQVLAEKKRLKRARKHRRIYE